MDREGGRGKKRKRKGKKKGRKKRENKKEKNEGRKKVKERREGKKGKKKEKGKKGKKKPQKKTGSDEGRATGERLTCEGLFFRGAPGTGGRIDAVTLGNPQPFIWNVRPEHSPSSG